MTPEVSIGEQALNAFKDPSLEHFPIYFIFAATMMAISAFAYAAMPQNKVQGITYELGEALEEKEYIGKDNDEYFKELEAAKPFLASAENPKVLTKESILKLRKLMNKRTYTKYAPLKEEMVAERVAVFKTKDMAKYAECVDNAAEAFEDLKEEAMCDALEYLDIPDEMYELTMKESKDDLQTYAQLQKDETDIRFSLEKQRELTESKDVVKAIYIQKLTDDYTAEMNLT